MKKLSKLYLLLGLTLAGCGESSQYVLKGIINGLPEDSYLYLVPAVSYTHKKPVAESVVENGKFKFSGNLPEPRLFTIEMENTNITDYIMIENSHITITGNAKVSSNGYSDKWYVEDMIIKGSQSHDLYEKKMLFRDTLNKIYVEYYNKFKPVYQKLASARASGDALIIDSINISSEAKALAKMEDDFHKLAAERIMNVIEANKDSWWGPLLMLVNTTRLQGIQEFIDMYRTFSPQAKESYYGQILKRELDYETYIGKKKNDLIVSDKYGVKRNLRDVTVGKKYILLHFWASWCYPCLKEFETLHTLYNKFASRGFEIICVSMDSDIESWLKFSQDKGIVWPNFIDQDNSFWNLFNGRLIPMSYILDEEGVVVSERLQGEQLIAKVEELFNKQNTIYD